MQKQNLWLKRSESHYMLRRFAALFVRKRVMISGFSVRGAKIDHMKTDGGCCFCGTSAHE
jgi:hypothetical protein